jgi:hypothetical protein
MNTKKRTKNRVSLYVHNSIRSFLIFHFGHYLDYSDLIEEFSSSSISLALCK